VIVDEGVGHGVSFVKVTLTRYEAGRRATDDLSRWLFGRKPDFHSYSPSFTELQWGAMASN
jgi:hypothetical protein